MRTSFHLGRSTLGLQAQAVAKLESTDIMKIGDTNYKIAEAFVKAQGIKSGLNQVQQAQLCLVSFLEKTGKELTPEEQAEFLDAIHPFMNGSGVRQTLEKGGVLTPAPGGAKAAVDWSKLLPKTEA
jgi:hypothetical protein